MESIEAVNLQMDSFKRQNLKDGLAQCTEEEQMIFKRMYSHKDVTLPINEVVDKMLAAQLDWATTQVFRTIEGKW